MLAHSLDLAKRQEIETYFTACGGVGKIGRVVFCDRSGEMPCWYWKRVQYQRSAPLLGKEVTQIVSREYDGTEYVWRVYQRDARRLHPIIFDLGGDEWRLL